MRGRKPKPEALARLHGNPGKRRKPWRRREPPKGRALGAARPPEWLCARGRAKWRSLVREFDAVPGLLARLDRDALAAICAVWARMVDAQISLRDHGVMVKTPERTVTTRNGTTETTGGALVQSPMLAVFNRCLAQLTSLWASFGMTPADRARLTRGDVLPLAPPPDGMHDQAPSGAPADDLQTFIDQRPGRTIN